MPIDASENYNISPPGDTTPPGPGNEFAQNNKALWLSFGYALDQGSDIYPSHIRAYLNGLTAPVVISVIQAPVRFLFFRMVGSKPYKYVYEFTNGAGSYGALAVEGNIAVQAEWLKLLYYGIADLNDLTGQPNTVQIDLGQLNDEADFIDTANNQERDLSNAENQYYFIYTIEDVTYSKRFNVDEYAGYYGGSYPGELTAQMFFEGPNTTPGVIPSWRDTLEQNPVSDIPPRVKDANGNVISLAGQTMAITFANGKTLTVKFDQVDSDRTISFPLKHEAVHIRIEQFTDSVIIPQLKFYDEVWSITAFNTTYTEPYDLPGFTANLETGEIKATDLFYPGKFTFNLIKTNGN